MARTPSRTAQVDLCDLLLKVLVEFLHGISITEKLFGGCIDGAFNNAHSEYRRSFNE